jgi:WD40 repeat protein
MQHVIEPAEAGTGVSSLTVSPDGRILVAGYSDGKTLRWSMAGGGAQEVPVSGSTGSITSLAFSPSGRLLAAGGADGRIYLLNTATWTLVSSLIGHTQQISSLAFSPDGTTLASASADNSVRLWDVGAGQPLGQPLADPTGSPTSIAYSPDGTTIAVGSADGFVRVWSASLPAWTRQACRIANRNLTPQEWRQYLGDAPYRETCPGLG